MLDIPFSKGAGCSEPAASLCDLLASSLTARTGIHDESSAGGSTLCPRVLSSPQPRSRFGGQVLAMDDNRSRLAAVARLIVGVRISAWTSHARRGARPTRCGTDNRKQLGPDRARTQILNCVGRERSNRLGITESSQRRSQSTESGRAGSNALRTLPRKLSVRRSRVRLDRRRPPLLG